MLRLLGMALVEWAEMVFLVYGGHWEHTIS